MLADLGVAGDEAVVAVVGPLTAQGAPELLAAVEVALTEHVDAVDIDLSDCERVDLDGARALERAAQRCAAAEVALAVRGADRFVRHLVEGLRLDVPLD